MVRSLFRLAAAASPSIIFFDEIDAIGMSRDSGSAVEGGGGRRMLLSELLVQMENVTSNSAAPVVVIAATNKPSDVDDAVLRRFDCHISVGLPRWEDRMELLRAGLQGIYHELAEDQLHLVADQTERWSGSDLAALTRTAVMYPVHDLAAEVAAGQHQHGSLPPQCRAVKFADFGNAFEGMSSACTKVVENMS